MRFGFLELRECGGGERMRMFSLPSLLINNNNSPESKYGVMSSYSKSALLLNGLKACTETNNKSLRGKRYNNH
jgi:hypothetical protein